MTVNTSMREGVALIEISREEALNALNDETLRGLAAALDQVETSECKGIVFLGAGEKAFCAGADIAQLKVRTPAEHRQNVEFAQSLFERIRRMDIPSVAVIQGFAFGGGMELALACTFRIASPKARMGLPEVKLGLIPAYGGTQRLPRLIGEARALELILSGRAMDAQEADRVGLVNRIYEEASPAEAGLAFIHSVTALSPLASARARMAVRRGLDTTLEEGLAIEADLFLLSVHSADAAEGISAFLEKRAPVFKGN